MWISTSRDIDGIIDMPMTSSSTSSIQSVARKHGKITARCPNRQPRTRTSLHRGLDAMCFGVSEQMVAELSTQLLAFMCARRYGREHAHLQQR